MSKSVQWDGPVVTCPTCRKRSVFLQLKPGRWQCSACGAAQSVGDESPQGTLEGAGSEYTAIDVHDHSGFFNRGEIGAYAISYAEATESLAAAGRRIEEKFGSRVSRGRHALEPVGLGVSGIGALAFFLLAPMLRSEALLIAGFPLLLGGLGLYWLGRELNYTDIAAVMGDDPRPPILLLRSFADDEIQYRAHGPLVERDSFEDHVSLPLKRFGPVIAVGRPGEQVSYRGAVRAYFSDEDWQQSVVEMMDEAALIVAFAGRSAGIAWELRQVSERGAADRLIVVFPPIRDKTNARWEAVWRSLSAVPPRLEDRVMRGLIAIHFSPWGLTVLWSRRKPRMQHYCVIRAKAASESGASRPPVLAQSGHPF